MSEYERYLDLRKRCGFDADLAMAKSVWDNCTPEDQKNMADQFVEPAKKAERYLDQHGEVW